MANSIAEDALRILPEDLSHVVESMMHVYQGNHDQLPDLLSHAGRLVMKVGKRLSTGQLLAVGGLIVVGALLALRQVTDDSDETEDVDHEVATSGARAGSNDKP